MSKLIGTYNLEKNENLDAYYKALEVPYVARKMMALSNPKLTIFNNGDEWTITSVTTFRTVGLKFKLGEEYDEDMPGGTLKSTTTMENENTLKTVSIGPKDTKIARTYVATDEGCVITFRHEATGIEGKRHFKRIA